MPDVLASIGNTPMIRVNSLSDATGCDVMIKCEFANPGGSVKDRVALKIIREAMADGTLRRGGVDPDLRARRDALGGDRDDDERERCARGHASVGRGGGRRG